MGTGGSTQLSSLDIIPVTPVKTGNALSSQPVSRQVLSTYECLTSVFGMGTGGSTQLSSPDFIGFVLPKLYKSEPTSQSLQVKLSAY